MDEENQSSSKVDDTAVDGTDNSDTDGVDKSTDTSDEQIDNKSTAADGPPAEGSEESDANDLANFAKAQGFSKDDLENETTRKAIELARKQRSDSDKAYAKEREIASKVSTFGDDKVPKAKEEEHEDPLEAKVAGLEQTAQEQTRKIVTSTFFMNNPDANKYIDQMDVIAQEKPYLYGDLGVLFELAQARGVDADSLREAGKQEARDEIANAGQANAPASSASNSAPTGGKAFTRSQISGMGRDEYAENRTAIIAAEDAGTVVEDI